MSASAGTCRWLSASMSLCPSSGVAPEVDGVSPRGSDGCVHATAVRPREPRPSRPGEPRSDQP